MIESLVCHNCNIISWVVVNVAMKVLFAQILVVVWLIGGSIKEKKMQIELY